MAGVLLTGEAMALLTATTIGPLDDASTFTFSLAGAEANVAIGLARLGHQAYYLSRLGNDHFGRNIRKRLEKENVDTSCLVMDDRLPTGIMTKSITSDDDPEIAYYRHGSAFSALTKEKLPDIPWEKIDQLHITGIPSALNAGIHEAILRLVKEAKARHVFISFDPNLRPQLWPDQDVMIQTIHELASLCDQFMPGIAEARILCQRSDPQDIARYYQKLGVKEVIIKLGAEGAWISGQDCIVPGYKVAKVVDTVGAGDGFAAGVISARLEGCDLYESVRRGNAIGAMQVMVKGDNEGLPDRQALEEFIKKQAELFSLAR